MIEKQQDSRNAAPDKSDNTQVVPENAAGKTNEKSFKSLGWRIHNELTYRGIDWLLNSSVGVAFAYWSARTKSGEKYFQKPISSGFKALMKPFIRNVATREEGAEWATMFAGIMAGGFTIIPPMMAMEDKENKKKIVRWMDEKIYGKEVVENDPRFSACYTCIDEEPKKDFNTGMVARLIAISPLIAAASTPSVNMKLMKHMYDPIGNQTKKLASAIGIKPSQKMLTEGAMVHLDGNPATPKQFQNNWDFLHRTIGFDFGLTIFYAIFHEMAYKGLAAMGMKKEQENEHITSTPPSFDSLPSPKIPSNAPITTCDIQEERGREKRWQDALKAKEGQTHGEFDRKIEPHKDYQTLVHQSEKSGEHQLSA